MGSQRKITRASTGRQTAKSRKLCCGRDWIGLRRLLPKHKSLSMETANQLRSRLRSAFKRYSAQDAAMRSMSVDAPDDNVTLWIHGINAQSRLVSDAERDYKAVRLEYANRLLSVRSDGGSG